LEHSDFGGRHRAERYFLGERLETARGEMQRRRMNWRRMRTVMNMIISTSGVTSYCSLVPMGILSLSRLFASFLA